LSGIDSNILRQQDSHNTFRKTLILNTLYLRIPSKHSQKWPNAALDFALCREEGAILREGRSTLSELAGSVSKSNVVLLISATDVTLLELTIPPMPEARLKQALPNLVEDQLISDSKECVLLLGARSSVDATRRTIAAAQRSWLQQLSDQLFALGAHQIRALPLQLCLPWKKDQTSAYLDDQSDDSSLTLRSSQDGGMGIMLDADQRIEERLSTITMLTANGPVALYLPAQSLESYKAALNANPLWAERFAVHELNWPTLLQNTKTVSFNLMAGLNAAQSQRIQWQLWRWPLVLAALVLLVNIGALNYDYWNLKREAQALKQSMVQTYKTSFPKDTVVLFPLEQMKKNLDNAERSSGQASPDDFTMLLTEFGSVWGGMNAAQLPKLVSVEYKDRGLVLQVKGDMPQKELQTALDAKDLVLKKTNADVWTVKVAK